MHQIRFLVVACAFALSAQAGAQSADLPAKKPVKPAAHKAAEVVVRQDQPTGLPHETLYCKFWNDATFSKSLLIYDPKQEVIWTETGTDSSRVISTYTGVAVATGLPPYGDRGFVLTRFGDSPIVAVHDKDKHECDILAFLGCPPETRATWGLIPGGPSGVKDQGECQWGKPGLFEYWDFDDMGQRINHRTVSHKHAPLI